MFFYMLLVNMDYQTIVWYVDKEVGEGSKIEVTKNGGLSLLIKNGFINFKFNF